MSDAQSSSEEKLEIERIKLWDPALRLFHWALVICVGAAWGLGKFGPDIMTLHFYFGYAVCALAGFSYHMGFCWVTRCPLQPFHLWAKISFELCLQIVSTQTKLLAGAQSRGGFCRFCLARCFDRSSRHGARFGPG